MTGWPWPLDGAQDWFEDFWNWVSDAAFMAGDWIWQQVSGGLKLVIDTLMGAFKGIAEFISPLIGTWDPAVNMFSGGFMGPLWSIVAGLQNSLTDIMGDLGSTVSGGLTWVTDSISGLLDAAITQISDVVTPIYESLSSFVGSLGDSVSGGLAWLQKTVYDSVDGLARWLSDSFVWLQDVVEDNADYVVGQMGAAVSGAFAGIGVALQEAAGSFMDIFTAAFENLFNWIWGGMQAAWKYISGGINWFIDNAKAFFTDIIQGISKSFRSGLSEKSPPKELLKEMTDMGSDWQKMMDRELKKVQKSPVDYKQILTIATAIGGVSLGVTAMAVSLGIAADAAHPMKEFGVRRAASLMLGYLGVQTTIAPLVSVPYTKGVLVPLEYFFNAQYQSMIPGIEDGKMMLWRGNITKDEYIDLIHAQGYGGKWEEGYKELTNLIPGPGDLIRFVVREVITEADFVKNMAMQGYSEDWGSAYWQAHWILPAFTQLVDAFHRNIINTNELDKYVIWHDYNPEPRPGQTKSDLEIMRGLLKRLIPRVDLRRGWELGEISDEDLLKRYEWLGYEEDAPLMARIQMRVALEAEISKVRDNSKKDFTEGFITENSLRSTLSSLGYGPTVSEYHVQDALGDRERQYKLDLLRYYEDGYVKGLMNDPELKSAVEPIIIAPEAGRLFLDRAFVRKYKKPKEGS